jgi:hypothetical protein
MRTYPQLSQHFNGLLVMTAILLNHLVYGLVVAIVYSTGN